jgi:hypothetical protein
MRRYDDPVEVRVGEGADTPPEHERAPSQFLWHGRLWKVRAVLAHWVETGPWWSSPGVRAAIGSHDEGEQPDAAVRPVGDLLTERELWRVEAGRGRAVDPAGDPDGDTGGIFDLAFDWADGRWQLVGCVD